MVLKLSSGRFPAKITRARRIADFVLTETIYSPGQKLSWHSHERACFLVVLQGAFTESFSNKTRLCTTSSVIFRPQDEAHADRFHKAGGRCLTVEIAPRWLDRTREQSINLSNRVECHDGSLTSLTKRLYYEFCEMDSVAPLAIEGLILEMIAEFSRRPARLRQSPPAARIEQAKEMVQAQFSGHLTLAGIAERAGLHPVYLAREFRRNYRCTIGEYIRCLRIQAACNELSNSDAPLIEIALSCGFSDQSHFTRTFKRLTGMTPGQYRSTLRSR